MTRETLVMIPPMLADARVFWHQLQDLSRDHAVMVCPASCGERMEEIASQILSWAPARFALIGAGMGGMVAMEILRRAPDAVSRLALISTNPLPDTPQAAAERETQMVAARAGRWGEVLRSEVAALALAPATDRPGLTRLLDQMGRDFGPEVYIRQTRAMQRRRDQQATLRKMRQPTLVIGGDHDDPIAQKRLRTMAEMIPTADLDVIEEAGALPTLEAPEVTSELLRRWIALPLMLR